MLLSELGFASTCAVLKCCHPMEDVRHLVVMRMGMCVEKDVVRFVMVRKSDVHDHPVYAWLKGSAIIQDGQTANLTSPNGPSQEAVIKKALHTAGCNAEDIVYHESHGTGTSLGDPIEIQALCNVHSERTKPLYVGAVKTNVGHLEPAAGIVGLIKTILVCKKKMIPPNINFKDLNPLIHCTNIVFPDILNNIDDVTVYASVSSFGFGGTNSHIILESSDEHIEYKPISWKKNHFEMYDIKNEKHCYFVPIYKHIDIAVTHRIHSIDDILKLKEILHSTNSKVVLDDEEWGTGGLVRSIKKEIPNLLIESKKKYKICTLEC